MPLIEISRSPFNNQFKVVQIKGFQYSENREIMLSVNTKEELLDYLNRNLTAILDDERQGRKL